MKLTWEEEIIQEIMGMEEIRFITRCNAVRRIRDRKSDPERILRVMQNLQRQYQQSRPVFAGA